MIRRRVPTRPGCIARVTGAVYGESMNSNETRTARAAAFEAYQTASAAFNTAFAAEGPCRKVSRLANLSHKAMEDYRFAQARHEQALRIEMAGATERDIMAAALA